MSTRNISWGRGVKVRPMCRADNLHVLSRSRGTSTTWNPQGVSRDYFTFTCFAVYLVWAPKIKTGTPRHFWQRLQKKRQSILNLVSVPKLFTSILNSCNCKRCSCTSVERQRGGVGSSTPSPHEIPKALQNRAKLNPIVKTVKNCWILVRQHPKMFGEKKQ